MGVGGYVTPRPLYVRERDPVPIVQEAGWAPGPVWMGAENLAHTGTRWPDRPTRSESIHQLSNPGPLNYWNIWMYVDIFPCCVVRVGAVAVDMSCCPGTTAKCLKIHSFRIHCAEGQAIKLKTVRMLAKTASATLEVPEIQVFWEVTA